MNQTFVVRFIGEEGETFVVVEPLCRFTPLQRDVLPFKEELGNTSSSPRASVISIPELFTYATYIVIAFVLEVFYIASTLLLVLLSISCWCT